MSEAGASPAQPLPGNEAPRLWHVLLAFALGALGFFITFSSAGASIALAVLIALAAVQPRRLWRSRPWKEPAMAVGLALLAYIAAHTLVTTGVEAATWQTLSHYKELLLAPLLMALLQDARHRRIFLRSVVAGAVFLALLHWGALIVPGLETKLASRRISAGFALAVCAFVVLVLARGQANPWPARGVAALLALTVLFAVHGRTGHLVLLVLVACAGWLHAAPRWRWLAGGGAFLLVLALAMGSGAVVERLEETLAGSQPAGPAGTLTSTGIRIELLRVGGDLARQYGATGAGFANYGAVHQAAARARASLDPAAAVPPQHAPWIEVENPHNEYLMQLISGGAAALVLFLVWLSAALAQAARSRAPLGGALAGITLAFAVGSLFNSLLLDFVEGHLYVALLAWLLAERHDTGRQDAPAVQRILVVATRQIGDVLLTTSLMRAARRRWPQARIEVLGFQGTLGMLKGNPDVNKLIEARARLGLLGFAALVRRLWRRYDLALVTQPSDRAHLTGWIAAPRRSGIIPEHGTSNWWKKLILDHVVVSAGDCGSVHAVVEKTALLDPWVSERDPAPQVVPPGAAPLPPSVEAVLAPGAVVVHAPSMWSYKQWPLAHFEAVVRALLACGRQVVLTGSGSTRDQECIAPLRALGTAPALLDLSGQLDFNQLATLLARAALYIGPDTSVTHLAAASGVPVIALFGPSNPMRWGPWPARAGAQQLFLRSSGAQQAGNVTVLQGSAACVPCGRAGCEDHRQSRSDCLVDIKPERVLEEALNALQANSAPA